MTAVLSVEGVTSGYGKVEVLHELSLAVPAGSVVALLGPNGSGKTTTLRVVAGTLPAWRGSVHLSGRRVDRCSACEIARRGLVLIPEGRGIFPALSVADNLAIAARSEPGVTGDERHQRVDGVLTTFPRLRERLAQRAGTLSGGEQQMLAMTRAFLANPRVLMMDEISMGLAPIVVEQLFDAIAQLQAGGLTIVLVEQYLTYALRFADICYVLAKGRTTFVGEPDELRGSRALASSYLGV